MLIALLAVLGVDLIVIVALAVLVILRKRWVMRQDGAFRGAARISSGELDGFGTKWRRGYGRWVRDVLVWTKGPLLLRSEVFQVDTVDEDGTGRPVEVKRLGEDPVVATIGVGAATAEVAVRHEDRELLLTPRRPSRAS